MSRSFTNLLAVSLTLEIFLIVHVNLINGILYVH